MGDITVLRHLDFATIADYSSALRFYKKYPSQYKIPILEDSEINVLISVSNPQLTNKIREKIHNQIPQKLKHVIKYNKIYYTNKCIRLAEELEARTFTPQTKETFRELVKIIGEYITVRDIDSLMHHTPTEGHFHYRQQLFKIYNILNPVLEVVEGFFVVYWNNVREDLHTFIEFLKNSSHFEYLRENHIESLRQNNYHIDKRTGLYVHERFVYNSRTRSVEYNQHHSSNVNSEAIYLA